MPHQPLDPRGMVTMNVPNYTHGMITTGAARWLSLSGQVGLRPDGTLAGDAKAQIRQAFQNIGTALTAAQMSVNDVYFIRIFLLDRADIPALREARAELFGKRPLASTLVIVSGLVDPDWKVEIEAFAAAGNPGNADER